MHKVWTLEHQIITSSKSKDKKEINSVTFVLVVKPQALDQSKRVRGLKQSNLKVCFQNLSHPRTYAGYVPSTLSTSSIKEKDSK